MKSIKAILVAFLTITVAACGGGGSSTPAPTYTISGTAVSATVTAGVTINLTGDSTASAVTDNLGNYSFAGLANGTYVVTPVLTGYSFSPAGTSVTVSGADVPNTAFTATAAATTYSISGAIGGAVGSGVTLTLSGDNSGSTLSDSIGNYTFAQLLPGSYTVTASRTGYTFSAAINITLGADSTGNDFTATAIPLPHSISGNVSPTLAGTTITVTGFANATATTDASGNFTVTGLDDGNYTLTPSKTGYTFSPSSTAVTMSGANVTGKNFDATANSSVLATINGSVTGPWIEGITITMSPGGSTTTTDANGAYSFANVPSGATYSFAASGLTGYSYTTESATIPGGSNTTVTVADIVATSDIASTTISGTITNNSGKTGRIYIYAYLNNCAACDAAGSTSIASTLTTGNYQIRGLPVGSYRVQAWVDRLGTGLRNWTDPSAEILSASGSGADITLAAFTAPTPTTPTGLQAYASDGAILLRWDGIVSSDNHETVAAYKIYSGTDAAASNGTQAIVVAHDLMLYVDAGLNNSSTHYYKISSCDEKDCAATESAASAVIGPITVAAPSGGSTVSGTVTLTPGIAPAPLLVLVSSSDGFNNGYFTYIPSANSTQSYTVTGVANGAYRTPTLVDLDSNGYWSVGDITDIDTPDVPYITVNGNLTNNLSLSSASAPTRVMTEHTSAGNYALLFKVIDGTKHVQSATVFSGPNIRVPFDAGFDLLSDGTRVDLASVRPTTGDSYKIRVGYSDGTHDDITANVTGVLDAFARTPVAQTTNPGSVTVPLFTWTAPASPPASYTYHVNLYGGGINWWQGSDIPSTQTSVLFNADGGASAASLTTGTHYWNIRVRDSNQNSAIVTTPYTVP